MISGENPIEIPEGTPQAIFRGVPYETSREIPERAPTGMSGRPTREIPEGTPRRISSGTHEDAS